MLDQSLLRLSSTRKGQLTSRILIVDDETIVLGSFERALTLEGYATWVATNSQEALKLCQENSFDLVILDFIMPGMDGLELLTRIRKQQPLVRSIVISGKIDTGVEESQVSKSLGQWVEADAYLHKPVSATKLKEAVASLLSEQLPDDWQVIARKAVKGQEFKIKNAKAASKNLKILKRKK